MKSILSLFFGISVLLAVTPARAVHLLQSAETSFFEDPGARRVQIQTEFSGLSLEESARAASQAIGGTVKISQDPNRIFVRSTSAGDLLFVKIDGKIRVTSQLLRYSEVASAQKMMTALKAAGAKGARDGVAAGLSLNLEINSSSAQTELATVVNFMRDYLRPQHLRQIKAAVKSLPARQGDLGSYSAGFMNKLLDPAYAPSAKELYFDYFYRQSLEYAGQVNAWSMSEAEARKAIQALRYPVIAKVVEKNSLRISSYLMALEPNDPYTVAIEKSGLAIRRNVVELRDWNGDFEIATPVRAVFGLWSAAERYGYFDHDRLVSELAQIPVKSIRDLRAATLKAKVKSSDPTVFRYFLEQKDFPGSEEYTHLKSLYPQQITGYLDYGTFGTRPTVVPGESVVFHRRPQHRFNILGKYNPGLINASLMQALENKYVEAIFWNTYAPESISRTKVLSDYGDALKNPSLLVERLNHDFPNGWVLKGVWDFATQVDGVVTSSKDIAGEIAKYRASDFDAYRVKMTAELAGRDPEYIIVELIKHPAYFGWKLSEMLANAHQTIAQDRVQIEREYRVPVIAGRVVGDGATVDRYAYRKDLVEGTYHSSAKEITGAEQWAQTQINQLPPELRGMTLGLDVARLKNGRYVFIETNPGGNDGSIAEDESGVAATNRFLRRYPKLAAENSVVDRGLSPEEQIRFLQNFFAQHNIDVASQYPGMSFQKDKVEDPMFVAKPVRTEVAQVKAPQPTANLLTAAEQSYYQTDSTRVGIEVEFWNLTPRHTAELVAKTLGGSVAEKKETILTTLKTIKPDGTRVYNEQTVLEYVVKTSSLGEILIKPDNNMLEDVQELDASASVVELVTVPLVEHQVHILQNALYALQSAGAKGTDIHHAVATQMNTEIAKGHRDNFERDELPGVVALLKNFIAHETEMRRKMDIPKIRQAYVQGFSKGLKQKLMDPTYKATERGLYDDVIYRQSLEFLGYADAWTMPILQARETLLKKPNPVVPQVVKQNFMRLSSLLMWLIPSDPMSEIYKTSGWAKARPLIEYRGFNNTFEVVGPFRQAVGLNQVSKTQGFVKTPAKVSPRVLTCHDIFAPAK